MHERDELYFPLKSDTERRRPPIPESDAEVLPNTIMRKLRATKKRADIKAVAKKAHTDGSVWAGCIGAEIDFRELVGAFIRQSFKPAFLKLDQVFSDVLFCTGFECKCIFIFKFGCIVGWDCADNERDALLSSLYTFVLDPLEKLEDDDMMYAMSDKRGIKQDTIHLLSLETFEKLAYSYAFAQSVKLSHFETQVDATIERTRSIPEGLAQTGHIKATRVDISRRIGELFISRFYINLHTDILDTPDILWEFDEYSDFYSSCRSYLEIPKRVEILNQRLDIIKDLYDMLNNELTIQHGHRLEWIVIYLICIEVVIEVIWNILLKDIFRLV